MPFSSPEAALLLVSTKNRDLWPGPTTRSPRFTDFSSFCACSKLSLTNLIRSYLNLLCSQIHSKPRCRWCRWIWPEVAIFGADQKERGRWGRECTNANSIYPFKYFPARASTTSLFQSNTEVDCFLNKQQGTYYATCRLLFHLSTLLDIWC